MEEHSAHELHFIETYLIDW